MSTSAIPNTDSHSFPYGHSVAMQAVYDVIGRIAPSRSPILIRGERGVRKEDIARLAHTLGPRPDAPFVKVSWSELTETFVEGELFGYANGDAAGRAASYTGYLAAADGGTLFIEEVSDFSAATQSKLLRFLREGTYQPLGDETRTSVNARVIAASGQDLEQLVDKGKFHREFLDEVGMFTVWIPPLRERKTDILHLAQQYVRQHARILKKPVHHLSSKATSLLVTYAWPGNLVELEHCMERAVLTCDQGTIDVRHLPGALRRPDDASLARGESMQDTLESIEYTLIVDALKQAKGNRAKAAQLLGITERLMGLRVKKYEIEPKEFRTDS